MNPQDQSKIDAIERDRKKREDQLLIALLLLWDDAADDITVALRHGFAYQQVIGNYQGRITYAISTAMANAHRDGVKRLHRLVGETTPQSGLALRTWTDENAGTIESLREQYKPAATDSANAMGNSVGVSVAETLPTVAGLSDSQIKAGVRDAMDGAGYTAKHPRALDVGAERAIVGAHNNGLFNGAHLVEKVTGLRHSSVLDNVTTDRCRERDGLTLAITDPYWASNMPPLHYNCRSTVLPITGEFAPSDWRPTIPPALGFGLMSATFLWRMGYGQA